MKNPNEVILKSTLEVLESIDDALEGIATMPDEQDDRGPEDFQLDNDFVPLLLRRSESEFWEDFDMGRVDPKLRRIF